MKYERSNVEFPLWRKKADSSLFEHKGTTIPSWACSMWDIPSFFDKCVSKKDPNSEVTIKFEHRDYTGWVTAARKGRKSPAYRLWFGEELSFELKHKFLMSYMRSLEKGLRGEGEADIEIQIPFWEFLDIEFDKTKKLFRFVAYYYQEPSFPEFFKRLIASPAIQKIDNELESKSPKRIHKQGLIGPPRLVHPYLSVKALRKSPMISRN